jgi:hypothetical protein
MAKNRGNKITSQSQSNAAWSMVADKWEKTADQRLILIQEVLGLGEETAVLARKILLNKIN